MATLAERLDALTAQGELYEQQPDGAVRCVACGHRCLIRPGRRGICKVRFNAAGALRVPWGYVAALQCDPTEKKPFFHLYPGSDTLTFGMLGCDFHCGYCQNWLTSQTLRDPAALAAPRDFDADELVRLAVGAGAPAIVSTYNEPLITSEWSVEIFRRARNAGLVCGFVSNGNATPEALDYLHPHVALYKVDLKGMRDRAYRTLGGKLHNVLESIERLHAMGFWVEIVTLLVPGFNDDPAEIDDAARFIAGVSPDIPWHVTAFHRDYKMTDGRDTTADDLRRVCERGREAGLHHVYAGNLPGRVDPWEDTRCPGCAATLIRRRGYQIVENRLGLHGRCPDCRAPVAGYWTGGACRVAAAVDDSIATRRSVDGGPGSVQAT